MPPDAPNIPDARRPGPLLVTLTVIDERGKAVQSVDLDLHSMEDRRRSDALVLMAMHNGHEVRHVPRSET